MPHNIIYLHLLMHQKVSESTILPEMSVLIEWSCTDVTQYGCDLVICHEYDKYHCFPATQSNTIIGHFYSRIFFFLVSLIFLFQYRDLTKVIIANSVTSLNSLFFTSMFGVCNSLTSQTETMINHKKGKTCAWKRISYELKSLKQIWYVSQIFRAI